MIKYVGAIADELIIKNSKFTVESNETCPVCKQKTKVVTSENGVYCLAEFCSHCHWFVKFSSQALPMV
jgi:hypothetical protein